jgi:CPA2 family monovalent cation:H+ antiporter-2
MFDLPRDHGLSVGHDIRRLFVSSRRKVMSEIQILKDIALIFALSVASLYLCHRLRLPPIVGFLIAGVAVGPFGLELVQSVHEVEVLAEVGIVLLLFTIGIEFSIRDLLRSRRAVLLGGGAQVALTSGVVLILVMQFDVSFSKSLFAGFLVALSSTAIVLRTLQDSGDINSAHGRTILSILIFQDIVIAPMIIIAPLLAGHAENATASLFSLAAKAIIVVVLILLLAHYAVPHILELVIRTRSRELFLLTTILICVAIAWATSELGLSLGLGAFLAGLVISESEYSHNVLDGILPFKTVFTSFFFVSIGMLLDVSYLTSQLMPVLGLSAAVLVLKSAVAIGVALSLGLSSRAAVIVGLSLSQVGEFSFILSRVGVSFGLVDQDAYQLFLAVSITTMAITPFLINAAPRLADRISTLPPLRIFSGGAYFRLDQSEPDLQSLNDHLVIVGFGVNGRNIARAARGARIPYVIIEMNPDTVKAMRREGEPILYGDATSQRILESAAAGRARVAVIAISDPTAARRITQVVRDINPSAYIIVRTPFVKEVQALLDLGAGEVIPEEFETSVEIFTRVLMKYMVPLQEIDEFVAEVRSQSYAMFRSWSQKSPKLADLQVHAPEIEIASIRLAPHCAIAGQTLREAELRNRYGVTVLAVLRGEDLMTNPDSSIRLEEEDILYVMGSAEQCIRANRALASDTS